MAACNIFLSVTSMPEIRWSQGPLKVGSTQIAIICVEGHLIALLHSRAELAEESCLVGRRILLC